MKYAHQGVSLVEILVVMFIMSIVIVGGFAGYSKFTSQKKWEKDIEAVHNVFSLGVQKAAARDIQAGSCPTFSGYEIETVKSAGQLTLYLLCPTRKEVARYILVNSSVLSVSDAIIQMHYPYGALDKTFSLVLKNAYASECQELRVSPQGVISLPNRSSC